MTDAQAAWLRKLRDKGPQGIDNLFMHHTQAVCCLGYGWSDWNGDPNDLEEITPAGLAALAEHEAAKAKPAAEEGDMPPALPDYRLIPEALYVVMACVCILMVLVADE